MRGPVAWALRRGVSWAAGRPLADLPRLGARLGRWWHRWFPVRRRTIARNLAMAVPDAVARDPDLVRKNMEAVATTVLESLWCAGQTRAVLSAAVAVEGWERYERAMGLGRGVIVATAHLGSFDLAACSQAAAGVPLGVLTDELGWKAANAVWQKTRRNAGVRLFFLRHGLLGPVRWLAAGNVLALMMDQRVSRRRGGVLLPLFGIPCWTSLLPVRLAARTGAAVLPVFAVRTAEGHRLVIEEPFAVDKADLGTLCAAQERLHRLLEGHVRAHPEQWLWMHRRFARGGGDRH